VSASFACIVLDRKRCPLDSIDGDGSRNLGEKDHQLTTCNAEDGHV
jgi:hypothetical protein